MRLMQITQSLREGMTAGERTEVSELVDEFGSRAFGPFLVLPAIMEISPLGAIPGLPTVLAVFITLVSFQLLIGRDRLWLPHFVARYKLNNDRVLPALETAEPIFNRMDHWFSGRQLARLTQRPFTTVAALFCIALAISIPPLELFPFLSTVPMFTVALIGSALLLQDGRLMLLARLLAALSVFFTGFAVVQINTP